MSLFSRPGSGGGITPEQLDQLVSDPELANSAAAIVAAVNASQSLSAADKAAILAAIAEHRSLTVNTYDLVGQRADAVTNTVNTFRSRLMEQLGSILNRGNALSLNGVEYRYSLGDDVAAIKSAVVDTPAVYSGLMQWVNRASGLPNTGFTKAGGVGVPDNFFNTIRTLVLPHPLGGSTLTGYWAAQGLRAVVGDRFYVANLQANTAGTVYARAFDQGVAAWASLPNLPLGSTPPTAMGTVNGKPFVTGFQSTSGSSTALYTFDVATTAWVPRASQAAFRCYQGVADLGGGRAALFGGKTANDSTVESATNIVNEVSIYSDAANTYTPKTALPVRMDRVRTAVRPTDSAVFLFPSYTSDGTTLVSTGRRVFLWSEAGGTVELDPIPAECVATPWLLHARADGTLDFVPYTVPSSGSRARRLNPSAAAGSQWTNIDWDYCDSLPLGTFPAGCEAKPLTSGVAITSFSVSATAQGGFTATYVGATFPNWSQTFAQIKN